MKSVNEIWLPAPDGFDLYEVSDQGGVRNRESGYVLRPWEDANNRGQIYLRVTLYRRDGSCKHWYLHRLVKCAHEPREDADNLEVNHGPGAEGTTDCRNDVLEWMTKAEHYAYTHGRPLHQPANAPF